MSRPHFPLCTLAGAAFAGLLVSSCRDGTGPDAPLAGSIAIVPVFESSAAALVPVERLRITLTRRDSVTIAVDTIIDLTPGQDSVDLSINVALLSSSEQFFLELKLINAAQDTVFRGGPTIVTASTSAGTSSAVEILLVYTGTGSDAATVRITTTTARAFFGETVSLAADALDATGNPIPGTPIKWSSVNSAAGSFPDDESGAFVTGTVRGPALVAATLLTGPTDTAAVMVQPPPSAIAITSGNDQTGGIGTALPQPLVVTVTAADGLGVEGVEVVFGVAAGNGLLSAASVFTDAQGMAQVIWTLGSVPGTMQATATVPAAGNASVTFVATAQAVAFRWLNTGGGNWSAPTNWDVGSVPSAGSTVIIDLDGTYTVNLDVVADVNVLTLGAATGTQTLAIATNSLTLNMASTVGANGVIDMSGGTLNGVGTLLVSGSFNWTGGTISDAGVLRIATGAALTMAGEAKLLRGPRQIQNAGSTVWTAGNIEAGAGAKIINQSGATFLVAGAVAYNHSQGGAMPEFDNLGPLDLSPVGPVTFQAVFNNSGSVNLMASTLALTGGGTGTGSVTVAAGTTLQFGGGTHIMGSLTGDGTVDVQSGIAEVTGAYTQAVTGVLQGAGILDLAGGLTSAGTVSMTGTLKVGGVLAPTGSFSVGTVVFQGTGAVPQIVPSALTPYTNVEVTGQTEPDGSMTFSGTFIVSGTGVFDLTPLSIATVTVTGDVSIIDDGMINVGGLGRILQANSNVVVANNADLYVGLGGGVNVAGNFSTQDLAMVRMTGFGDELNITGNATFGGGSNALMLTGGTVRVGGNFTQSGDPESYATSGTHSTVFTGTAAQTISFANPTTSMFQDLSGIGLADLVLATDVGVRGNLLITNPGSINGAGMKLTVGGDFTKGLGATVTLGTLEIGGLLTVPGTYSVTNTVFTGSGPQDIPGLVYNNIEVTGDVRFSQGFGSQNVDGDVVVSGNGILNTEMTEVFVGGNFRTQDQGILKMLYDSSYDILHVVGDVEFGGGSTAGWLTEGEIYVGGNFTQLGTNSPESFHAGGGFFFDVYFEDTPTRTIFFETPGIGAGAFSHFEEVGFLTNGTVNLTSDVFAHANISSSASYNPTLVGNGNKLAVGGVSVDGMVFDHVLFEANGTPNFPSNGSFGRFDNVSFVNYNPGDTQFTIIDPGGVSPYTLNNIIFGTTPTTGFYMDVTDSNPVGDVLTIQMANPTPVDPMTFVLKGGGAVVIWPWP